VVDIAVAAAMNALPGSLSVRELRDQKFLDT
jgi:hypothetical protein